MVARGGTRSIFFALALMTLTALVMTPVVGETMLDVPLVNLPADELPHPKTQAEWWYFSGHLEDEQGRGYGENACRHDAGNQTKNQAIQRGNTLPCTDPESNPDTCTKDSEHGSLAEHRD